MISSELYLSIWYIVNKVSVTVYQKKKFMALLSYFPSSYPKNCSLPYLRIFTEYKMKNVNEITNLHFTGMKSI